MSTRRSRPLAITFFLKCATVAVLNFCIELQSKWHKHQKERTVPSYCETVNYLLKTYATDHIIAETDINMMRFSQPSSKSRTEYAEAHWNMVFRCNRVYDEYELRESLLRGYRNPSSTVCAHTGVKEDRYSIKPGAPCNFPREIATSLVH